MEKSYQEPIKEIEIPEKLKEKIDEPPFKIDGNNRSDQDDDKDDDRDDEEEPSSHTDEKNQQIKEPQIRKKAASFFKLQYSLSTKKDNLIMSLGLVGSLSVGLSSPLFSVIFGESLNSFGNQIISGEKFMANRCRSMIG